METTFVPASHKARSATPPKDPVLIIGAGLGLVLAQRLTAASVPFRLFERDLFPSARSQGWSLSLSWILPFLNRELSHLQPSIFSNAVNAPLEGSGAFAAIDGYTAQHLMSVPNAVNSEDGRPSHMRANRSKLREWLAQGLDIEWNKRYVSHSTLPDGRVSVTFADGTSTTGGCLVGADGASSPVRHSLFAQSSKESAESKLELVVAPLNYITGTRVLPRHAYEKLLSDYAEGGAFFLAVGSNKRFFSSLRTV